MTAIYATMFAIDSINVSARDSLDALFAQCERHIPYATYKDYALARLSLRLHLERAKDAIEKEIGYEGVQHIPASETEFTKRALRETYVSDFNEHLRTLATTCEQIFYEEQICGVIPDDVLLNAQHLSYIWAMHKTECDKIALPRTILDGILNREGLKYSPEEIARLKIVIAEKQRARRERMDAELEAPPIPARVEQPEESEEESEEEPTQRYVEAEDDFLATDDEREDDIDNAQMSVYIASMNLRGIRAAKLDPESLSLNVTSAQRIASPERKDFSPMTEIARRYKGFWCFENYWQSGKVFDGIPHETSRKWWLALNQPKRKYPKGKGHQVLHATFNGHQYDYIESRKSIYVPEYYRLIEHTQSLAKWRNILASGVSITIYDFDGPRNEAHEPICLKLSRELLIDKINDPTHPFGHCYIVGAALLGIRPEEYTR